MSKELKGIGQPKDKDIVWRYMSFEKFADILATESLMDFLMKRREQGLKQGKKYIDFSPYREKNKATVNLNPASACRCVMLRAGIPLLSR